MSSVSCNWGGSSELGCFMSAYRFCIIKKKDPRQKFRKNLTTIYLSCYSATIFYICSYKNDNTAVLCIYIILNWIMLSQNEGWVYDPTCSIIRTKAQCTCGAYIPTYIAYVRVVLAIRMNKSWVYHLPFRFARASNYFFSYAVPRLIIFRAQVGETGMKLVQI